jgi:glycosyltransferase involved in cell wall biosynthesis
VARTRAGTPTVSVIVPVRDRRDLLSSLLDALEQQTQPDFEVIVVDDGSTDGSGDLARAATIGGRPVRVLEGGGHGAVAARSQAVAVAEAPVLAFTDSDCVPEPEWLAAGLAAVTAGADMVNGHTRPQRAPKPLERTVASGLEGLYPTCNMFFRRDLFDRVGGFDNAAATRWRFRPTRRAQGTGFGEDTLLGWQAVRSGAPTAYAPDAVVAHHVFERDSRDFVSHVAQVGAFPALVREIPELRDMPLVRQRILLGRSARPALYCLVVALVFGRRRLALLAALAWAGWRAREMLAAPGAEPNDLVWLPAEMAADVGTAAALVAGSIRARSVLL